MLLKMLIIVAAVIIMRKLDLEHSQDDHHHGHEKLRNQKKKCCFLSSQSQKPSSVFIHIYSQNRNLIASLFEHFCFVKENKANESRPNLVHHLQVKHNKSKSLKHTVQGTFLWKSE